MQVGSKLYMFIPSAILGFIIGMLVWTFFLVILRTLGVIKRAVLKKFCKEESDELELRVKYTTGDPWKKISDAEKIHSVNGSIRKSVIGPCSPEKIAEFNQQVLETVAKNQMHSPGFVEIEGIEKEVQGSWGQDEEGRHLSEGDKKASEESPPGYVQRRYSHE